MKLIGLPQAAKIIGIDRTTAWRWFDDKTLIPVAIVGSGARPRPLFDLAYIEAKAAEYAVERGGQKEEVA